MSGDIVHVVIAYLPLLAAAAVISTPLFKVLYHKIKVKPVQYILDNAGCVLALLLCTASLASSAYNPFLYFKF